MRRRFFPIVLAIALGGAPIVPAADGPASARPEFLIKADRLADLELAHGLTRIGERLAFRAQQDPFLPIASTIFLLAIIHTFLAVPITRVAHRVQHEHDERVRREATAAGVPPDRHRLVSFKATMLHFLGEIEAIFGIWVVVLGIAMVASHGLDALKGYLTGGVNFTEPLFVVVIMALASTRPILRFAENCLRLFARLGRETPAAWWLSILAVAPLLGSFITDPGAMTIAAMLLARKFYRLKPSPNFAYATLGLLFVNVSVGGVLTNFAAPPVLMVARKWDLTTPEMFLHFGDKAAAAIVCSTLAYFLFFRKELAALSNKLVDHDADGRGDLQQENRPIPLFITIVHLAFMAWTVAFAHYPPLFVGGFLFFLAFSQATAHHQSTVALRGPIMVGFFLAGLVIHGGLQGWWLSPIITSLSEWPMFIGATILTSFNDNAAITFLASQVEDLAPALKYSVLAGAVTGGGLTVIANAPNPAGQAILARFFGDGVSPLKLAIAALVPTLIVVCFFMLLPDSGIVEIFSNGHPAGTNHQPAPAATH
jgi:hypothetical protein